LHQPGVNPLAALVLPAIRWDAERGFEPARPGVETALAAGVGGFIIFGGERAAVQGLTLQLRAAAPHPLLIASDVERGTGQQVAGLTALPPALALAALGDDAVATGARITAEEARDAGIAWAFAPVVDLDVEATNPIVQTRSLGADPDAVGRAAARWIEACQAAGVLACAKHFPGHGRTTVDSHAALPVVAASRRELEADRRPYAWAVRAGVAGVMTAHVAFPALDPSGAAATYSRDVLGGLLRDALGFRGLVVTDALVMAGASRAEGEAAGAVRAVRAGCDLLLYPGDLAAVVGALERALDSGELAASGVDASLARRLAAAERAAPPRALDDEVLAGHRAEARELARAAVHAVRGEPRAPGGAVELVVVDDDAGAAYPVPPRGGFAEALRALGASVAPDGERVVLLFSEVRGGKGRVGLSDRSRRALAAALDRPATAIAFVHPRVAAQLPGTGPVWCAWCGDAVMQRAAAERLLAP
jgi:beta-glucosidase-like glycosyl hydrolase